MMKLLFVTFACTRDERLLEHSVPSVGEVMSEGPVKGVEFDHLLAFDVKDPVGAQWSEEMNGIARDARSSLLWESTNFARGTTLDGVECVLGEWLYYASLFERFPEVTHVVKMDADILMLGQRFLLDLHYQDPKYLGCGLQKSAPETAKHMRRDLYTYGMGGVYVISRELAATVCRQGEAGVREHLMQANLKCGGYLGFDRPRGPKWPEDECVSLIAKEASKEGEVLLKRTWQDPSNGYFYRWIYLSSGMRPTIQQVQALKAFDFVDFGKTYPLIPTHATRQQRLEVVREAMRVVREGGVVSEFMKIPPRPVAEREAWTSDEAHAPAGPPRQYDVR